MSASDLLIVNTDAQAFYERLMRRTDVDANGCFAWQGAVDRNGYGKISVDGRTEQVHRIAYKRIAPPFDHSLTLDHRCRNRACWNPDHLEPVTQQVNTLRGQGVAARNAAVTHCPQGHEYTSDNLVNTARRERQCKRCARERTQAPGVCP